MDRTDVRQGRKGGKRRRVENRRKGLRAGRQRRQATCMAAGIRTLPTPTPLGTVWPQKRDPLLEQIVLGLEKITQPTVLALKANIVPNTEHSEAFQWKSV